MKKIYVLALLVLVVAIIAGCTLKSVDKEISLNELQTTACEAAHENNNCAKLTELGLVTASDCCKALGKCC